MHSVEIQPLPERITVAIYRMNGAKSAPPLLQKKKKKISSIVPLTPLFSCLSSTDNTPTEARGQGKAGGCSS